MTENQIQREIKDGLNKLDGVTIYRNNVGVVKSGGRWIRFGLCKGSSDLIGYAEVEITPDMVGETVAVFTALEVKKPGGEVSDDQMRFISDVQESRGIGAIVTSLEEAENEIDNYFII